MQYILTWNIDGDEDLEKFATIHDVKRFVSEWLLECDQPPMQNILLLNTYENKQTPINVEIIINQF